MESVVFSSKKANPNVIRMAYSPGRSIFPWCIGRKNRGSKIIVVESEAICSLAS